LNGLGWILNPPASIGTARSFGVGELTFGSGSSGGFDAVVAKVR
jgi:hypothetical protein